MITSINVTLQLEPKAYMINICKRIEKFRFLNCYVNGHTLVLINIYKVGFYMTNVSKMCFHILAGVSNKQIKG